MLATAPAVHTQDRELPFPTAGLGDGRALGPSPAQGQKVTKVILFRKTNPNQTTEQF